MKQSGWLEKVGRTLLRSLWSFALGAHLWRTGVVLMVLGLGLGLSLRAHSAALWSEADIEKFEFFPQTQEIEATARACPPLFFGANAGGDKMIQMIKQELRERTETFRREIQEKEGRTVMVQTVTFNSQLTADSGIFAQMFDLDRNAEKQNRCTIGSATYRVVDANPKQSQAGPTGPVLRVGVRDGYRLLAEQHGAAWFGADINFAEAVGAKLNRRVEFYPLKNADERISLTRAGVVDMSISLITITEDRKKQVSFSNPYFKTGLVMGTFNYPMLEKNPQVIKDLETSEVPVT
ncbi:MAG: substrate-binding periplasmic protein, partial [Bdellovibrionales bacterium]